MCFKFNIKNLMLKKPGQFVLGRNTTKLWGILVRGSQRENKKYQEKEYGEIFKKWGLVAIATKQKPLYKDISTSKHAVALIYCI